MRGAYQKKVKGQEEYPEFTNPNSSIVITT